MMSDEEIADGEHIARGSADGRARRKRRAICGAGTVPVIAASALAAYLQECWSWGKYSPQECQRLAHLAMVDIRHAQQSSEPITFLSLEKLAKLGGSGKHPGNMHGLRPMHFGRRSNCRPDPFPRTCQSANLIALQILPTYVARSLQPSPPIYRP